MLTHFSKCIAPLVFYAIALSHSTHFLWMNPMSIDRKHHLVARIFPSEGFIKIKVLNVTLCWCWSLISWCSALFRRFSSGSPSITWNSLSMPRRLLDVLWMPKQMCSFYSNNYLISAYQISVVDYLSIYVRLKHTTAISTWV